MNLNYQQLIKDMTACEQTKGMSVLQHGQLVNEYYKDLMSHLLIDSPLNYEWRIPKWVIDNKSFIINEICNDETMQEYLILHDCGKPYCRTVDENGKHHFENHANVSFEVYSKLFPHKKTVAQLIKKDMDVHCLKSENIEEFSRDPLASSLLISALSEVHANASMFGGIESTSFKIKWKQIDKRGRQVFEKMPNT